MSKFVYMATGGRFHLLVSCVPSFLPIGKHNHAGTEGLERLADTITLLWYSSPSPLKAVWGPSLHRACLFKIGRITLLDIKCADLSNRTYQSWNGEEKSEWTPSDVSSDARAWAYFVSRINYWACGFQMLRTTSFLVDARLNRLVSWFL